MHIALNEAGRAVLVGDNGLVQHRLPAPLGEIARAWHARLMAEGRDDAAREYCRGLLNALDCARAPRP